MNKNKFINLIWIIIFILFFVFFTRLYPLILYDADDWTYVAQDRRMLPIIGYWNPSKVLPETLMPLCGAISAYLVDIFVNDYVVSFTIVSSFVVSFLITLYVQSFYVLIKKKFKLEKIKSIIVMGLFLIFHLVIFYIPYNSNEYLFYAHDLNCYYNLIPNIICFIIIFKMMTFDFIDYSFPKKITLKSGFILLMFLLSIFSNLYCNITLITYIASVLLINCINSMKNKFNIMDFIKKNSMLIVAIIIWIISLLYELTGLRAQRPYDGIYRESIVQCIKNLGYVICNYINKPFIIVSLVTCVFGIVIFSKNKVLKDNDKKLFNMFITVTICILVLTLYFILISAKVSPENIFKAESLFGLYAYLIIMLSFVMCYLLNSTRIFNTFIVILLAFFIVETNCAISTFKPNNLSLISIKKTKEIDDYIINEIINADENGVKALELRVPRDNTSDNWPISDYFGERISYTLFRHKRISRKIEINIIPDERLNEKFGVEN